MQMAEARHLNCALKELQHQGQQPGQGPGSGKSRFQKPKRVLWAASRSRQGFSEMGQIINILVFVGHAVSVSATTLSLQHKAGLNNSIGMSKAVLNRKCIYGHWNLSFMSFSHVMKYYSSFDLSPSFKILESFLVIRPYKSRQQTKFAPQVVGHQPWLEISNNLQYLIIKVSTFSSFFDFI